jgi:hypothetical protein
MMGHRAPRPRTRDRRTSIRRAVGSDTGPIASIWAAGWREAHQGDAREACVAACTAETFLTRARESIWDTLVATRGTAVVGFVVTSGDEVEQLYVDAGSRSEQVADALMTAGRALGSAHHREHP